MAAWICLFIIPVVFYPRPRDPNYQVSDATIQMFVCIDAFLVAFYYLNTNVLIPRFLTNRKWLWYILAIIVCFTLYHCIPKLFEGAILSEMPEKMREKMISRPRRPFLYPFTGTSAIFFLVFTVSTCTKVIQEWLGIEKKKEEVEREKLVTELSFLRSQVNPHFCSTPLITFIL